MLETQIYQETRLNDVKVSVHIKNLRLFLATFCLSPINLLDSDATLVPFYENAARTLRLRYRGLANASCTKFILNSGGRLYSVSIINCYK